MKEAVHVGEYRHKSNSVGGVCLDAGNRDHDAYLRDCVDPPEELQGGLTFVKASFVLLYL